VKSRTRARIDGTRSAWGAAISAPVLEGLLVTLLGLDLIEAPARGMGAPSWGTLMGTVLSDAEVQQALHQLPGWKKSHGAIERLFQFDSFVQAMEFVNKIAEAAEAVNHHPDILINYNQVTLTLISHDSGGVTQRDIKMAARINDLAPA